MDHRLAAPHAPRQDLPHLTQVHARPRSSSREGPNLPSERWSLLSTTICCWLWAKKTPIRASQSTTKIRYWLPDRKAPKRIYICCDRGIKRQVCLHTGFAAIRNCSRSSYSLRIKRFLGLWARIWACRRVTNGLRLTLMLGFTFLGNPEQFVTCSLLRGCKRREY